MTENKVKPTMEQTIYCLKAESERYPEVCEECQLYGEVGCDHCYDDVTDMAIKFLKELEQYRAIGTIEEFKELKEKNKPRELYGNEWNPVHTGDTVNGLCPVCMESFVCITPRMYKANNYGYCRACGQKLDWQRKEKDMAISVEECREMNYDGRCEEFDSCRECEEECAKEKALKQKGEQRVQCGFKLAKENEHDGE